jgi:hypothetical protein
LSNLASRRSYWVMGYTAGICGAILGIQDLIRWTPAPLATTSPLDSKSQMQVLIGWGAVGLLSPTDK